MNDIPSYINDWLEIIENMNTDNTYKLVWGRAILECINHKEYDVDTNIKISFEFIANKIIKYYWNQIFFFNLKQAPYIDREPVICREVRKLVERYKEITNNEIPVWYDKAIEVLFINDKKLFDSIVKKVVSILHLDVCYRFKRVNKKELNIYSYEKKISYIEFDKESILYLEKFNIILAELLNYKWAQLLESYNHQPKIVSKVKGISENSIKRNNLTKYKDILLSQFSDGKIIDFYTGNVILENEISIDHVIPWSFIYSDDLWNLVITTRSVNSSKSNNIPNDEVIEKLKSRNNKLISVVEEKSKRDLEYAIENKLVDKYYYDCKM